MCELEIEPEWCERCSRLAEENGVEYEFNYTIRDGTAYCDYCGVAL